MAFQRITDGDYWNNFETWAPEIVTSKIAIGAKRPWSSESNSEHDAAILVDFMDIMQEQPPDNVVSLVTYQRKRARRMRQKSQ